jgi:hypothetical protein
VRRPQLAALIGRIGGRHRLATTPPRRCSTPCGRAKGTDVDADHRSQGPEADERHAARWRPSSTRCWRPTPRSRWPSSSAGKDKAFNALVGQIMKASKGKANPAQAGELLRRHLG